MQDLHAVWCGPVMPGGVLDVCNAFASKVSRGPDSCSPTCPRTRTRRGRGSPNRGRHVLPVRGGSRLKRRCWANCSSTNRPSLSSRTHVASSCWDAVDAWPLTRRKVRQAASAVRLLLSTRYWPSGVGQDGSLHREVCLLVMGVHRRSSERRFQARRITELVEALLGARET